MAQFVGLAASLATILTGKATDSTSKATTRKAGGNSKESAIELTIFALGAVTALGVKSILERYRLRERLRHYQILLPFKRSDSNSTSPNETSQIEALLHNKNCLSSHLHIVRIKLDPKQGLAPVKSNGVEWIHILKGVATICIDGKEESETLEQEDNCTISPWTERFISNTGKSDLVFLLISDEKINEGDIISLQENGLGQKLRDALQDEGSVLAQGFQSIVSTFT